jgi:hypothetical protein
MVPESEFSNKFIEYMRNRMLISFYKYGRISEVYPHKVDAISSLKQRLKKYAETGNTEFLVDAANFAMIEFMYPGHAEAHFEGTDASASPGRTTQGGQVTKQANDEL